MNGKKYDFYYDETEHSRKINLLTISQDNYYDNFIAGIIGWDSSVSNEMEKRYLEFEEKYAYRKSKGELKSTTIRASKLKYGFASLDRYNVEFISDFFDLFDENILIYFSVISKIEYLIMQIFQNYKNTEMVNVDAMKYSITKSIIIYQPKKVMEGMYNKTSELIDILKDFYTERIEINKSNKDLKALEIETFSQLILILDDVSDDFDIDWEYQIAFNGFSRYLYEKEIEEYNLFLDMEGGQGATIKAAKKQGLIKVSEIDSKDSVGVRWADLFIGITGKMLKAIHNDLRYESLENGIKKKLLSPEWFRLSDDQLKLYKKMYFIVTQLNNSYYKSFSGNYADDLISFVTLLNFIYEFNSSNEINQKYEKLPELLNESICQRLDYHFEQIYGKA